MKKNTIIIAIAIAIFSITGIYVTAASHIATMEHEEFMKTLMSPEEMEIEELAEKITLVSSDEEGFVLSIDGELHNYTYEEPEEDCSLIESIMLVEEYDNSYVLSIGGELHLYHF